jgi:hypothetical protein
MQNGDFNEIREMLKNIALLPAQHEETFFNTPTQSDSTTRS